MDSSELNLPRLSDCVSDSEGATDVENWFWVSLEFGTGVVPVPDSGVSAGLEFRDWEFICSDTKPGLKCEVLESRNSCDVLVV